MSCIYEKSYLFFLLPVLLLALAVMSLSGCTSLEMKEESRMIPQVNSDQEVEAAETAANSESGSSELTAIPGILLKQSWIK